MKLLQCSDPFVLIGISGIDGAGKTTQIMLVRHYLHHRGFKVRYLWLRWFSFFTFFIYLYARLTRRTIIIQRNSKHARVHLFWVDRFLQIAYPRLLLFELLLWFSINVLIARIKKFDFVLLDRTFLDAIVDLAWETRCANFLRCVVCRHILRILKGIRLVILVAEVSEVFKRKKNEILSLRELTFKNYCFNVFAKYLNIPVINTSSKTIFDVFKALILNYKLNSNADVILED